MNGDSDARTSNQCAECGKPATVSMRVDPFGKSDAMKNLCAEHAPRLRDPADVAEIERLTRERDEWKAQAVKWEGSDRQRLTERDRLRAALERITELEIPLGISKPMPATAFAEAKAIAYKALSGAPSSAAETPARPFVVYRSCAKHVGIPWTLSATYTAPPKEVCPICEPPSKASERHALAEEIVELRGALLMLYDKWENGAPCYEEPEEQRGYFGHAFNLTEQEENRVLALLPEGCPEPSEKAGEEYGS